LDQCQNIFYSKSVVKEVINETFYLFIFDLSGIFLLLIVPTLTTVWKALALCISIFSNVLRDNIISGTSFTKRLFRIYRHKTVTKFSFTIMTYILQISFSLFYAIKSLQIGISCLKFTNLRKSFFYNKVSHMIHKYAVVYLFNV